MAEEAELEESRGRRTRFGFAHRPRRVTHPHCLPDTKNGLHATWQAMQQETGWRPEEALLPYAKLVRYKHVSHEDVREGNVWVDVVADGKPLRRNVGLLRYV